MKKAYLGVLAAALMVSAAVEAAPQIVGSYNVQGTNPGGAGSYTGTVKIVTIPSPQGDKYHVEWNVGSAYMGMGKLAGNTLEVVFGDQSGPTGKVTYTVGADGVLKGTWYMMSEPNKKGTETLTPIKVTK